MTAPDPALAALARLVGRWTTEATHPAFPGLVVHGTAECAWVEGERFLTVRSATDHPDFPGALVVIGRMDHDRVGEDGAVAAGGEAPALRMHYFDSRGVFRDYAAAVDDAAWRWWRDAPGFSQRFTGTFADGGRTIVGLSQLRRDDARWADDLKITYRRSD